MIESPPPRLDLCEHLVAAGYQALRHYVVGDGVVEFVVEGKGGRRPARSLADRELEPVGVREAAGGNERAQQSRSPTQTVKSYPADCGEEEQATSRTTEKRQPTVRTAWTAGKGTDSSPGARNPVGSGDCAADLDEAPRPCCWYPPGLAGDYARCHGTVPSRGLCSNTMMQLQLAQPHEVLKDLPFASRQQPPMCEAPVLEVGCGLCGRTDGFVTVHERLRVIATPSRVLRCPGCGLVFLSPRLASAAYDWAQYVSYLHTNYLPELVLRGSCTRPFLFDRCGNLAWHAQLLDALDDFRTGSTLLDVGCSVGTTLRAANDRGWHSHGVESSAVLATYGADQLSVDITIGEFDKMQPSWRNLDCVTMLDYLPHCFEPFESVRLARGLLRDGGALFVSVPNVTGRAHRQHGESWCCWSTDHYVYYDADTLMRSLRDAGFRSVVVLCGKPLPCQRLGRQRGRLSRASNRRVFEVIGPVDGDALYAWAIK